MIIKFILSIFIFILAIACNGQQEVDLVANYFPGLIPNETGLELGKADFPYQSWSFVQLQDPFQLIDINKDSIELKLTSFIIIVDDSTTSYSVNYDDQHITYSFYKDSIRITKAGVSFVNKYTDQKVEEREYYICDQPEFGFTCLIVIENIRRWSCNYSLYYSESCQLPSDENLIQYGKIRLRRNRKYQSKYE